MAHRARKSRKKGLEPNQDIWKSNRKSNQAIIDPSAHQCEFKNLSRSSEADDQQQFEAMINAQEK